MLRGVVAAATRPASLVRWRAPRFELSTPFCRRLRRQCDIAYGITSSVLAVIHPRFLCPCVCRSPSLHLSLSIYLSFTFTFTPCPSLSPYLSGARTPHLDLFFSVSRSRSSRSVRVDKTLADRRRAFGRQVAPNDIIAVAYTRVMCGTSSR